LASRAREIGDESGGSSMLHLVLVVTQSLLASPTRLTPLTSPHYLRMPSTCMSEAKYGVDPRTTMSDPGVKPAWTPGQVGAIHSAGELIGAVDAAATDGGFVAIKFWRDGCKACEATADKWAAAAAQYPKGRFYLVNYGETKDMCRSIGLKVVPTAHLYASGRMQDALPLGPSSWDGFATRLQEMAAS
jgi:thiol-disulfide isomerase/thioredoxin